jgi:radical SAM protein with 4Fe4S-binding SPASM domain
MTRNKYIILRIKLVARLTRNGKLSLIKIINATTCFIAYLCRWEKSARYPMLINFETGNECNSNCLFCRDEYGTIYDQAPRCAGGRIPKGSLEFDLYADMLQQVKRHILLAVLYVNGEPLMYRDIFRAIKLATESRVATMIASNGILLTEDNSTKLLDAGLDFIKIAISGFTQATYGKQHRRGNVEQIKLHIITLVELNIQRGSPMLIMLDYILYHYNEHELPLVREFCDKLGIVLSVRPGNVHGMDAAAPDYQRDVSSLSTYPPCDWLWKVLTVNWTGDIYPCCDCCVWSGAKPFERYLVGKTNMADVWNGNQTIMFRNTHSTKGRTSIPVCAKCTRIGLRFKY